MGVVVAAEHLELGGRVALKFVRVAEAPVARARAVASALDAPDELVDRMRREARIVFRLKGEHVTRLLDLGRLPSGAPYIVMEHLEGRDLGRVLAERGP